MMVSGSETGLTKNTIINNSVNIDDQACYGGDAPICF